MLKILPREPVPQWLISYKPSDLIPFSEIVKNSVYYPACGFDGDVTNLCMGYSHSFIYVDNLSYSNNATKKTVYENINHPKNFGGFKKIHQQEYSYEQMLGTHPISEEKAISDIDGYSEGGFAPQAFFAILTIFESSTGVDREFTQPERATIHHIYERMAFLYICDDGCRAYEKLFQSHLEKPKAIAMIQPGNAFGGNWTNYYDEQQIFSRIVHKNPGGKPDIIIFGGQDSDGGWYRKVFWQDYCEQVYYSRIHGKAVAFWKRPHL